MKERLPVAIASGGCTEVDAVRLQQAKLSGLLLPEKVGHRALGIRI